MKNYFVLFLVLVIMSTMPSKAQDGKLHKAKTNLTQKRNSRENAQTETSSNNEEVQANSSNFFNDIIGAILINLTYGILVETIFERESNMHYASLSRYPYVTDSIGNYVYDFENYTTARLQVDNSFIRARSTLFGNDFNTKFRFAKRFDLAIEYLELVETLNKTPEHFSLLTAMANYHRIRTQKLDVWYGAGILYVGNEVQKTGFTYNLGMEWFMAHPISIFGQFKQGFINQNSFINSKVYLKYYYQKINVFGGYQYYHFTDQKINAFSLGLGYTF